MLTKNDNLVCACVWPQQVACEHGWAGLSDHEVSVELYAAGGISSSSNLVTGQNSVSTKSTDHPSVYVYDLNFEHWRPGMKIG